MMYQGGNEESPGITSLLSGSACKSENALDFRYEVANRQRISENCTNRDQVCQKDCFASARVRGDRTMDCP